jgi:hypothetical protein
MIRPVSSGVARWQGIILAMVLPAYLGFSDSQKRSSSVKAVVGQVADWEAGSGANQSKPVSIGEHMRRCRFNQTRSGPSVLEVEE